MNKSILSWILGISFVVATPVAMADRGSYHHETHNYKQQQSPFKKHKHYNTKNHGLFCSISNNTPYHQISKNHTHGNNKYRSYGIHDRRMNQKKRIRKGIRKNQLARFEVRQLRKQQRRIANRLDYFKSDGHLSRYERAKIHNMLDRASRNIREKRHNQYVRGRHLDSGEYNYF